jgi:heme exporter protein D
MQNLDNFIDMGGYGAYVWPAYGFAALVLLWNLAAPIRRHRQILKTLRHRRRAGKAGA